ncbi:MAG: membrane integrity-associated transporter subunit PqiC [Gammaproteobacteria bacterium]|nr:membrane integrity-associated transporter subunit PqiC [Gammaproteobacteria bacterium]
MNRPAALVAGLVCLVLSACAMRPSTPNRLFGLTPQLSAAPVTEAGKIPSLVVGPVDLPAYTRRAPLLTLHGDGEYRSSSSGRWAEPLEQNVTRVLAENLSRALGTPEVSLLGAAPPGAERQVMVQFSEFVVTDQQEVRLIAYWRILDAASRNVLASGKREQVESVPTLGDADIAAGMSRALAALSGELAAAVRAMHP